MKYQNIKNAGTGAAYVTHYGKRLYLNMFERCNGDSITYNKKSLPINGWYNVGYAGAYGIHVSECGEKAIVVYRQNF